jgi:hypothetical protein
MTIQCLDMSRTAINRQQEGLVIANIDGAIKRISELRYVVKSQTGNGDYEICSTELEIYTMIFDSFTQWFTSEKEDSDHMKH